MKLRKFLGFLSLTLLAASLPACSDDKDDEPLPTPPFEADAALYKVTQADAPFSALELTASGNYIIIGNASQAQPAQTKRHARMLHAPKKVSNVESRNDDSTWDSGILFGTFTKISADEFALQGYGTVKIVRDGNGNAVSLQLTYPNGTSETVGAAKATPAASSTMTDNLCRTWQFEQIRYFVKLNGKTMFDFTGKSFADIVNQIVAYGKKNPIVWEGDYDSFEEWKQDMENEMLTDYPVDVVFTKSGTYMVKYSDSSLAVATWHWVNESQGILGYWWGFDDEDQEQQKVDVSFKGQRLNIVESDIEHDEDGTLEEGFEYVMVPAK